jgi:hypothetical protein
MHVVLEGVSRTLLAAVWYFLIREWQVGEKSLLDSLDKACSANGVPRSSCPYLNPTRLGILRAGQLGNLPQSDAAFPGTAAQVMHLVLISLDAFSPLLSTSTASTNPVWLCYKQHVGAVAILLQRSFTAVDIAKLDEHIWLQDTLWLLTPKIAHMWKPKNHYLQHLPLDIVRWGPPRLFWCMLFEHENQLFKRIASHSNFANVLHSCAHGKAMHVALLWLYSSTDGAVAGYTPVAGPGSDCSPDAGSECSPEGSECDPSSGERQS